MQLFILRHGDAPFCANDAERTLSERGRGNTLQVVSVRLDELNQVEHIVCSPIRRARDTLKVVTETLEFSGRLSFEDCLRSEASLDTTANFVNHCPEETLLLISHQPLVGQMLNYLADQTGLGHQMGTSCLACFDALAFSRGAGELRWIETP